MELAIVLIVALVIFGPKKLPELGSSMGRGLREFKGSLTGDSASSEPEAPKTIQQEIETPEGTKA
jgi:sec-independent protein translocase protein TatA